MLRRRKKKKQRKVAQQSMLGRVIDLSLDDFKKELEVQKVNIGVNNNLILLLEATYNDLRQRKEAILDLVFSGQNTKEEVKPYLEGIYAEMVKIEQKVTYLKERSKKLLDVDNTTS